MAWKPGDRWEDWTPLKGRLPLKSVHACELESWTLLTWPAGASVDRETGEIVGFELGSPGQRPFLCGSWRCRRCARWRGAVDFTRSSEAVRSRSWWLYLVLTFDPSRFASRWEAYREAGTQWNNSLREAFRRKVGKFEYLQTWEAHRSRWPHVNVILTGESLRSWVEELGVERRMHAGYSGRERLCMFPRRFRQWLKQAAVQAGFGEVAWAEVLTPENPEAMAGYLCKLSRELTGGIGGEKGEQSPIDAPKGFRRIRASRGLLPPTIHDGNATGRYTGSLRPSRCATEPHGPRVTRERPARSEASWEAVAAALESKAKADAQKWARENGGISPEEALDE